MRPASDPEAGTTLTEILVVLTVTTVLAIPLLTVVRTASRLQDRHEAESEARIELDQSLALLADDLRNGEPTDRRLRGTTAADAIAVEVDDGAGLESLVYWSVDRRGLRRVEADAATRRVRRRSTVNRNVAESGDPVFRYFDADGRELDPDIIGLERLAECTTLVEVRLSVPIEGDPEAEVVTGTARHAVRSRTPGANQC